jgi:hypothetical protein
MANLSARFAGVNDQSARAQQVGALSPCQRKARGVGADLDIVELHQAKPRAAEAVQT